jgi:hypothetical protein
MGNIWPKLLRPSNPISEKNIVQPNRKLLKFIFLRIFLFLNLEKSAIPSFRKQKSAGAGHELRFYFNNADTSLAA